MSTLIKVERVNNILFRVVQSSSVSGEITEKVSPLDQLTFAEKCAIKSFINKDTIFVPFRVDTLDSLGVLALTAFELRLKILVNKLRTNWRKIERYYDLSHFHFSNETIDLFEAIMDLRKSEKGEIARQFFSELADAIEHNIAILSEQIKNKPSEHLDIFNRSFPDRLFRDLALYLISQESLDYTFTDQVPEFGAAKAATINELTTAMCPFYNPEAIRRALDIKSPFLFSDLIVFAFGSDQGGREWGNNSLKFSKTFFLDPANKGEGFKHAWRTNKDPVIKLADLILPEREMSNIKALLDNYLESEKNNKKTPRLTFLLSGAPGTGKSMLSEAVARYLGKKMIIVDPSSVKDMLKEVLQMAHARALATNSILVFEECEDLINQNEGNNSTPWIKLFFEEFVGVAVFTSNYYIRSDFVRRITYPIVFETPNEKLRTDIMKSEIKKAGLHISADLDESCLKAIMSDYKVSGGYFPQALELAGSLSAERILTETTLRNALSHFNEILGFKEAKTAKIAQTTFSEVKLNAKAKKIAERFIQFCRQHLDHRDPLTHFPMTALFHGLPGTGKTMLAGAVANSLGLQIKVVTASDILGPYVGETESNIAKLFASMDPKKEMHFIDEAEGLLGARESSHQRWELSQTNEFLKQIEKFKGVLVIATNLISKLDSAFMRRFIFQVQFENPNQETRLEIWQSYQKMLPEENHELLPQLAQKYPLSGGEIRNVALKIHAFQTNDRDEIEDFCKEQLGSRNGESEHKRVGI
jgi:SpoVK/Ycf46/Vps4 family AAA+-type ATPase